MQTSHISISNLINRFENQEFSSFENKRINNVYDSLGTLYGEDEEKVVKNSFFLKQEEKISHSQHTNNNNFSKKGSYFSVKEKIKFFDKESAETLITKSNENVFPSEILFNNYKKESVQSLPQFKNESCNNEIIERSAFSLSNIDNIEKIENGIENKMVEEELNNKNISEKDEINHIINEKKFNMFDVNKVLESIIRIDIAKDYQEEINNENDNDNKKVNINEEVNEQISEDFSIIDKSDLLNGVEIINNSEIDNINKDLDKEKPLLKVIDEGNKDKVKIDEKQNLDYEASKIDGNIDRYENNQIIDVENNQEVECNNDYSQEPYKEKIIDKRFKLTYVLARGGCGEIRATEDLVTKEELVCKVIPRAKKPKINKNSETYQYYLDYELDLLREATISSILIHPNILYMKYMVRTANYFYLISEKIDGEDLCDYIMKNGSLPEKKAREIIYEVIVALQYLHNNYIIHRDIKCENIMIEKGTGRIVLLDFGSACFYTNLSSQINEFCGSPVYQAPEVILSQPYWGPELDIWGLGVVLYVLTTGILPFDPSQPNMNDNNMIDLMYSGPEYPDNLSYELKMLLTRMLCFDPNQRAKIPDILKNPWMRSYVQYKKLKVFDFTNNVGGQDNFNFLKKYNKSNSSLSLKTGSSRISLPQGIKKFKFGNLLSKTKKVLTLDTSENINKYYMSLQKEQLILNSPFSTDSSTLVDSIFCNQDDKDICNRNGTKSVVSQMFAYAVSREDETKENKIKLLKNIMNNQMRIQRNIIESS